jgi:hypothetical protein
MAVVAGKVTMAGAVTTAGMDTMAGVATEAGVATIAGTVIMAGAAVGGIAVGLFPHGTAGAGAFRVCPLRTGIVCRFADNANRKTLHFV